MIPTLELRTCIGNVVPGVRSWVGVPESGTVNAPHGLRNKGLISGSVLRQSEQVPVCCNPGTGTGDVELVVVKQFVGSFIRIWIVPCAIQQSHVDMRLRRAPLEDTFRMWIQYSPLVDPKIMSGNERQ